MRGRAMGARSGGFVWQDFIIERDKITRELGYTPRFTPEEAIARTVEWHRRRALSA